MALNSTLSTSAVKIFNPDALYVTPFDGEARGTTTYKLIAKSKLVSQQILNLMDNIEEFIPIRLGISFPYIFVMIHCVSPFIPQSNHSVLALNHYRIS